MIKFKQTNNGITIQIPWKVLKQATNEHPAAPARIVNKKLFIKGLMFELENNLGDYGDGTGFQELIDKAIEELVTGASDSVKTAEDDEFED